MLYEINGVERNLGGRKILDIASLTIRPERIYSLTGPNGAGKTTLLKLLAFLEKPSSGEMRFRSEPVIYNDNDLLNLRRQVVLVDQSPLLFTGTVARNVEFGLRVRKVRPAERRKRVLEALQLVGMGGFIEAEAHKLSGGETKRVALARALAVRPKVLLCDEPTANVDSENQRIILDILADLNRREKTSIIFSTHHLSQEHELAQYCLHLEHGKISEGTSENLFLAEKNGTGEHRCSCLLAGQLTISLPETSVPAASCFYLTIDQKMVVLSDGDDGRQGSLVQGRVTGLAEDNGMIRLQVDAGIPLSPCLSREEYQRRPILVGASVTLFIPDRAIQCIADAKSAI